MAPLRANVALLALLQAAASQLVLDGGSDWTNWQTQVDGVIVAESAEAPSKYKTHAPPS